MTDINDFTLHYEYDDDFKMTKEQAYESIILDNKIGLTGELDKRNFTYQDGKDLILKIDSEELGKALEILIKENSHNPNFRIIYEGSEENAEVVGDFAGELNISFADKVETIRLKGIHLI